MSYRAVMAAIIDAEIAAVDGVAYRQAAKVPSVTVEEDTVEIAEDVGPGDVEALLAVFTEIQGSGAYGIARRAVEDVIDPDEDLILPPEILPVQMKQDSFLHAI